MEVEGVSGLVASYDIRPGDGVVYSTPRNPHGGGGLKRVEKCVHDQSYARFPDAGVYVLKFQI